MMEAFEHRIYCNDAKICVTLLVLVEIGGLHGVRNIKYRGIPVVVVVAAKLHTIFV
jgi:hypothetical protein